MQRAVRGGENGNYYWLSNQKYGITHLKQFTCIEYLLLIDYAFYIFKKYV